MEKICTHWAYIHPKYFGCTVISHGDIFTYFSLFLFSPYGMSWPLAYMNTQDIARFAVAALDRPQTIKGRFPIVGPKAWSAKGWAGGKGWDTGKIPRFS